MNDSMGDIEALQPQVKTQLEAQRKKRPTLVMEKTEQVKIYTSGPFKGEARYQFLRNVEKMAKNGWRLKTVTDEGVGDRQEHTGRYKAVYEK